MKRLKNVRELKDVVLFDGKCDIMIHTINYHIYAWVCDYSKNENEWDQIEIDLTIDDVKEIVGKDGNFIIDCWETADSFLLTHGIDEILFDNFEDLKMYFDIPEAETCEQLVKMIKDSPFIDNNYVIHRRYNY